MEGGRNDSDHRNCYSLKKLLTISFQLVQQEAGEDCGVCAVFSIARDLFVLFTPTAEESISAAAAFDDIPTSAGVFAKYCISVASIANMRL